ncbi:MAG: NAD-dependent epimerase/dehydratase family protein [Planctomycetes bacterium]|nr:NAD-dependent epimerase/dehydratase family protein [Planctomycetota bacterium]
MLTLVTGATGLVGNNVLRLLLERGMAVRVLARETADARPLSGLNVEVVRGDVRDEAAVRRAVAGVQRVVHAAARVQLGWSNLELQREINVAGTRRVAIAAREAGATLVHVSSSDACGLARGDVLADEETAVEGGVPTPYVITKREAEQAVQAEVARGLQATIVNPAFMLGPWDWKPSSGQMLIAVAKGQGLLAPRGDFSISDVRDVAAAILAALDRTGPSGRRYLLAGHNLSYFEAWRQFAEGAGVRRPLAQLPPVFAFFAGRGGDLWGRISRREPNVNSGALAMARLPKRYSIARAEAELGYRIRPLRDTVSDALAWFREHGYLRS